MIIPVASNKYPLALSVLNNERFLRGVENGVLYLRDVRGELYGGRWLLPYVMPDSSGNPQMKLLPRYLDG